VGHSRLKSLIAGFPEEPGIYKMFDLSNTLLYIGKAINLRKRVRSYFSKDHGNDLKTAALVSHIHHIETIVTISEKEALILENQLIKHFQPHYNINLKDDKTYPYIKITSNEAFPRILITRRKEKDGAEYFGPYPSLGSSKGLKKLLYHLFPLRDCTQRIDLTKKQPKCINLDLGTCIGPCIFKEKKAEYDDLVSSLKLMLKGKDKTLVRRLQKQMARQSKERDFENAAITRDKLKKVEALSTRQTVDTSLTHCLHILGAFQSSTAYYLIIHVVMEGKLLYQHGLYTNQTETLSLNEFITQSTLRFYQDPADHPNEILCAKEFKPELLELGTLLGTTAPKITVPIRGKKLQMVYQATRNAKLSALRLAKDAAIAGPTIDDAMESLKRNLSLKSLPSRIIGFDISHYYGNQIVASAVYFEEGKPKKAMYRQFKIKSLTGGKSNDPAAIYEVVLRRIERAARELEMLPELCLIDGGIAQVNAASDALRSLLLPAPITCVGLAKKQEELYLPGRNDPISLSRRDPGLQLLQRVRDEAHRFALRYQKQRRTSQTKESQLSSIAGIGPDKQDALYRAFKSVDKIKATSPQELAKIKGIGLNLAKKILDVLNA